MKNLQKDSSGSQRLQQVSCQPLSETRRFQFCRMHRQLSVECRDTAVWCGMSDNFVARRVSQSASLFYTFTCALANVQKCHAGVGSPQASGQHVWF